MSRCCGNGDWNDTRRQRHFFVVDHPAAATTLTQDDRLPRPRTCVLLLLLLVSSLLVQGVSAMNRRVPNTHGGGIADELRVALAGGIAGAVGTGLLYPIDTAKTLRQANPTKYTSVRHALLDLLFGNCVFVPNVVDDSPTNVLQRRQRQQQQHDMVAKRIRGCTNSYKSAGVLFRRQCFALREAYSGVIPATIGAIPSSALYFGTYETSKRIIGNWAQTRYLQKQQQQQLLPLRSPTVPKQPKRWNRQRLFSSSRQHRDVPQRPQQVLLLSSDTYVPTRAVRIAIHSFSAACGNAISSLVFVPKEYVKQQMQAYGSGKLFHPTYANSSNNSASHVLMTTIRTKGIRGLYCGYRSTLMRNVPSAILRFALYEELKLQFLTADHSTMDDTTTITITDEQQKRWNKATAYAGGGFSPIFFVSGALAGAIASAIMTPIDVVKTRLATGIIPQSNGVFGGAQAILKEHGLQGLYAGAGSRMVWSGAFSAIGFGTFEAAKSLLGVHSTTRKRKMNPTSTQTH